MPEMICCATKECKNPRCPHRKVHECNIGCHADCDNAGGGIPGSTCVPHVPKPKKAKKAKKAKPRLMTCQSAGKCGNRECHHLEPGHREDHCDAPCTRAPKDRGCVPHVKPKKPKFRMTCSGLAVCTMPPGSCPHSEPGHKHTDGCDSPCGYTRGSPGSVCKVDPAAYRQKPMRASTKPRKASEIERDRRNQESIDAFAEDVDQEIMDGAERVRSIIRQQEEELAEAKSTIMSYDNLMRALQAQLEYMVRLLQSIPKLKE